MNIMENGNTVIDKHFFKNDSIMIFGGAGSLGTTLVTKYLPFCKNIIVVSRDEAKQWELHNYVKSNLHEFKEKLITVIGDVRDFDRINEIILFHKPNNVIIAQALKQVDVCEVYPEESIKTNIIGVNNILKSIENYNSYFGEPIKNVCFVSTDKACNPINVYGMCKRISEKLVLSVAKTSKSKYVVTRYGNVLSSKGSIVPLFLKQAKDNNYLSFTVTDPNMTRFLMTLEESVDLIDKAIQFGKSGDIWVPKLKSIKIYDLATYFSKKFNKPIQIIGVRPGEKIHEILLSAEELASSLISNDCYIVKGEVTAAYTDTDYSSKNCTLEYSELKIYMDTFLN